MEAIRLTNREMYVARMVGLHLRYIGATSYYLPDDPIMAVFDAKKIARATPFNNCLAKPYRSLFKKIMVG